ncbi:hypothetical protein [Massilia sp. PWRC2]|uniref:hypothetical protein n=1 Tax=Massilia sp. PWRC2 TaxID=2804626 RepID=UPI003CF4200A
MMPGACAGAGAGVGVAAAAGTLAAASVVEPPPPPNSRSEIRQAAMVAPWGRTRREDCLPEKTTELGHKLPFHRHFDWRGNLDNR